MYAFGHKTLCLALSKLAKHCVIIIIIVRMMIIIIIAIIIMIIVFDMQISSCISRILVFACCNKSQGFRQMSTNDGR